MNQCLLQKFINNNKNFNDSSKYFSQQELDSLLKNYKPLYKDIKVLNIYIINNLIDYYNIPKMYLKTKILSDPIYIFKLEKDIYFLIIELILIKQMFNIKINSSNNNYNYSILNWNTNNFNINNLKLLEELIFFKHINKSQKEIMSSPVVDKIYLPNYFFNTTKENSDYILYHIKNENFYKSLAIYLKNDIKKCKRTHDKDPYGISYVFTLGNFIEHYEKTGIEITKDLKTNYDQKLTYVFPSWYFFQYFCSVLISYKNESTILDIHNYIEFKKKTNYSSWRRVFVLNKILSIDYLSDLFIRYL